MLRKLIIKIIAVIVGILLPLNFCTSCSRSSEITVIGNNQSNNANKKPMTTPHSNIETAPTDLSKAPTVSYCELIKNSAKYNHKIVRVRAIYFTAFEKMYLYDEACEIEKPPTAPEKVPAETWAEWDKSFVSKGDSEEAKLNRQLNGFGRKDVTLIGKFNSTNEQDDSNAPDLFGHLNCCRFQFQIMRLEKIYTQSAKAS
jgi:hypothetical protein